MRDSKKVKQTWMDCEIRMSVGCVHTGGYKTGVSHTLLFFKAKCLENDFIFNPKSSAPLTRFKVDHSDFINSHFTVNDGNNYYCFLWYWSHPWLFTVTMATGVKPGYRKNRKRAFAHSLIQTVFKSFS